MFQYLKDKFTQIFYNNSAVPTKNISYPTAEAIAGWYAQYIPGVKHICFSDIHKNNPVEPAQLHMSKTLHYMTREASFSSEQINSFVDILTKKLIKQPYDVRLYTDYHPPKIVGEALAEAGIIEEGLSLGWFPEKTRIDITTNSDNLEKITINGAPFSNSHTACEDEAKESPNFIFKLEVLRDETDLSTGFRHIDSVRAECFIVQQCDLPQYFEDNAIIKKLAKLDLYPWINNDQAKIQALCGVITPTGINCAQINMEDQL